jgi:hypothetical protein
MVNHLGNLINGFYDRDLVIAWIRIDRHGGMDEDAALFRDPYSGNPLEPYVVGRH